MLRLGGFMKPLSGYLFPSAGAAAPEVPPDVESGSADRGIPGGSKGESPKRNAGEEEGENEEEDEGEDEGRGRRRAIRTPGRGAA